MFQNLTLSVVRSGGRNRTGRVTCYHRGGGTRLRYRVVDFSRVFRLPAIIRGFEKDPRRKTVVALVCYANGALSFILCSKNMGIGALTVSGPHAPIFEGNHLPLFFIPQGSSVFNGPFFVNSGSFARAPGSYAKLLSKRRKFSVIRLPSREHRLVASLLSASYGVCLGGYVSPYGFCKAGTWRNLGRRPRSRGVATNPVDHPHGGRTQRGNPARSSTFGSRKFFRTSSGRNLPWVVRSRRVVGRV